MANNPNVKIAFVANIFSKMMHFEKSGDIEQGHCHEFDHLTMLAAGRLKVTVEGQATEFVAPHMIYIQKDKMHELVAMEDNTVAFCIHVLRSTDGVGDILDPTMIPKGVDLIAEGIAKPLIR